MKKDPSKKRRKRAVAGAKRKSPGADGQPPPRQDESDEMRPEYDPALIRSGVRGKYAQRYAQGTNVVLLEPDIAEAFPDADSVNAALRALLDIARRQTRGRAPSD
jgi:hypothetical protein